MFGPFVRLGYTVRAYEPACRAKEKKKDIQMRAVVMTEGGTAAATLDSAFGRFEACASNALRSACRLLEK